MTRWLVLILALVLGGAACGGDSCEDDTACKETTRGAAATPTGTGDIASSDGGVLLEMLDAIPDTEDTALSVTYLDLEFLAEVLALDRPAEGATAEDVDAWWRQIMDGTADLEARLLLVSDFVRALFENSAVTRAELGFDIADITQAIQTGRPPATFDILRGRFDAAEVDAAVQSDPKWSDVLEEKSYKDVDYYSWGDDYEQDFDRIPTARDQLGRGGRFALIDGLVFWTLGTDETDAAIRSATEKTGSLADRPEFAAMTPYLAELPVLSVYMTNFVQSVENYPDLSDEPLLLPYLAWSVAGGQDESGAFMAVIIANADEETASANVDLLAERIASGTMLLNNSAWSDAIDDTDIRSEGNITIAILRGDELPWTLPMNGAPLLLTE